MGSKNINNDSNKQPQLGCVKWVEKTSTTTTRNKPQLGCVKWVAKTSTTTNKKKTNNLNWDR
jgi:hypothetical protein